MEKKEVEFEINVDNINVEDIMSKIRKRIKDRNYIEDEKINSFNFSPEQNEEQSEESYLLKLNKSWNINLEREIISKNKIFAFLKRVIRKSLRWYIKPIMQEQIMFNFYLVKTIENLNETLKFQSNLIEKNEKIIENLEVKMKEKK